MTPVNVPALAEDLAALALAWLGIDPKTLGLDPAKLTAMLQKMLKERIEQIDRVDFEVVP